MTSLADVIVPRCRPIAAWTAVLVLAPAIATTSVQAQTMPDASAVPAERFRPAMDESGVLGAEHAAVPGHLRWGLSFFLAHADDPLVLHDEATGAEIGSLVARRSTATLAGSVALWDRVQLGLQVPLIVSQGSGTLTGYTTPSLCSFGLGDLHLVSKVQLLRVATHGLDLALVPSLILPTGGGAHRRGEPGLVLAPELVASRALGSLRLTSSVGYRARPDARVLDLEAQDEVFFRGATTYRFHEALNVPLETGVTLSAATPASAPMQADGQNHIELMAGASYTLSDSLTVMAAGGVGLDKSFGTPDWRMLAGIRLRPRSGPARKPRPALQAVLREAHDDPANTREHSEDTEDSKDTEDSEDSEEPQITAILTGCKVQRLEPVVFAAGSAAITGEESLRVLGKVATILAAHPELERIQVIGHAGDQDPAEPSRDLSQERATAVVDWLVAQGGIDGARLHAAGSGQDAPALSGTTGANSQVDFEIPEGASNCVVTD